MMIPIVERSIERGHRLTTLATKRAPHHSPAFVSCSLTTREIEQHILADPQFLRTLAGECKTARNPHDASVAVHLKHHPFLLPLHTSQQRSQYRKQLVLLTYRCDPREQYERYPLFDKHMKKHRDVVAKAHKPQVQQNRDGVGTDNLRAKYAMLHLQSVLEPGAFITLPSKSASALLTISDNMLHSAPIIYNTGDETDIESRMLDTGDYDQPSSSACVFRVVHLRPSQQRYIHSAGFVLPGTSIAIAKVSVRKFREDTQVYSLALEPGFTCIDDSTYILSASDIVACGVDVACETLLRWQEDGPVEFSMSELPDDVDRSLAEPLLHKLAAAAGVEAIGVYHNEQG